MRQTWGKSTQTILTDYRCAVGEHSYKAASSDIAPKESSEARQASLGRTHVVQQSSCHVFIQVRNVLIGCLPATVTLSYIDVSERIKSEDVGV